MSNHEMGYVFDYLLRKFDEALDQNPGEHFTPREVIRLMVDLVLMFDTDLASGEGVARTVNDCCCGTGGMLTITKDRIQQINPQAKVFLYGQELNPQTWAIARSDMLKAKDGEFFISDWLRNGNTVELLGIWESVFNPALNYGESAIIKSLEFEKHESVPDSKTIEFDGIKNQLNPAPAP